MIYVASVNAGKYIKVGYTNKTAVERLAQLQTGNPFLINLVMTVEGSLTQEQEIHKALTAAFTRINIPIPSNEWYPGKHPVMKEFIEHLKLGCNVGLGFIDKYDPANKQYSPKHGEPKKKPLWERQQERNTDTLA